MIPVTVKLWGKICDENGENMPLSIITTGEYQTKNGMAMLRYLEGEESGFGEDVYTTLLIKLSRVTMVRRTQEGETRMDFEKDKTHFSYYETPFGSFQVAIATHSISTQIQEKGGSVYLSYELSLGGNAAGKNELHVEIKADE